MEYFLTQNLKAKLNALAYYQIIGGGVGILILFFTIVSNGTFSGLQFLLLLLALGLYYFSIYCGQQLLKQDLKKGFKLTTINLALQSINFAMFGYAFKYVSGFLFSMGIDFTNNLQFTSNFAISTFQFNINFEKQQLTVGFNLFSFFLIYFIGKLQDQIENNRQPINITENNVLDSELVRANQSVESNDKQK